MQLHATLRAFGVVKMIQTLGKSQKNRQNTRAEKNTQVIAARATTDLAGLFLSLHHESIFSILKILFFGHETVL